VNADTNVSYKIHFSQFLDADPTRLHVAAHSHHPWPDVTFGAQQQAWLDAARKQDDKWGRILGDVIGEARRHVAQLLSLPDPATVVFAPTTHELFMRLLSAVASPARILTTDAEFHSFERQARRLEEAGLADVERVAAEPYDTFANRFEKAAAAGGHDLVFASQVHFNSGYVIEDLAALVGAVPDDDTVIVIDGYHGFMALSTDLGAVADRVFYLAGGYKYAMSGEGVCFMHCPPGYAPRPVNTGWFAGFGDLSAPQTGAVGYPEDGSRFFGGTLEHTGIYRFNAVQRLLGELGVTPATVHERVAILQDRFLSRVDRLSIPGLGHTTLVPPAGAARGNFLTFRFPGAGEAYDALRERSVVTDYRGDRLRFGFGLYHDAEDLDELCKRLRTALT
jgi:kynureninase